MIKKHTPKTIYDLEIDHYSHVSINENRSGCRGCEDYCRCTTIDPEVVSIHYYNLAKDILDIVDNYNPYQLYALEKWLENNINCECFECTSQRGYYGEEMGNVYFNSMSSVDEFLKSCENLSNAELIKIALTNEHGFLVSGHLDIVDVKPQEILVKDFLKKVVVSNTNPDLERVRNLDQIDEPINLIVQKEGADKLKLIDGHHRLQALLNKIHQRKYWKMKIYSQKDIDNFESILKKDKCKFGPNKITIHELIIGEKEFVPIPKQKEENYSLKIKTLENKVKKLEEKIRKLRNE